MQGSKETETLLMNRGALPICAYQGFQSHHQTGLRYQITTGLAVSSIRYQCRPISPDKKLWWGSATTPLFMCKSNGQGLAVNCGGGAREDRDVEQA